MNRLGLFFTAVLLGFFLTAPSVTAERNEEVSIGIDEHLGEQVDLNFTFLDENGHSVNILELIDRPTILSFVYFNCPGICTPLLGGLLEVVDRVDLEPGVDFNVITISINDEDTPEMALKKKSNYLKGFERPFPEDQWWWLTGDSSNIYGITQSVGFNFQRTGNDFAHPGAIMILTADGKLARYLYGITFNQFDLKMAILEASEGRSHPSIASSVVKFCFSYDPGGRRYVFNFMRISGGFILLFAMVFLITITLRSKKQKQSRIQR